VKTGVQIVYNHSETLDSGFRRNDGKTKFEIYEIIPFDYTIFASRVEIDTLKKTFALAEPEIAELASFG